MKAEAVCLCKCLHMSLAPHPVPPGSGMSPISYGRTMPFMCSSVRVCVCLAVAVAVAIARGSNICFLAFIICI